jgi:DNA-binding transcriptional regulator WhiA
LIIRLETDLEISDFIWKGLNQYYYWQESVVNLSDSKTENESDYLYYLSQNSNPESFFNSLKHPDDRFSWIVDDYD